MIDIQDYLIGGTFTLVSILLFIIQQFAKEYITNLVKTIFNSKNDKSALLIFHTVITVLFIIGVFIIFNTIQKQEKTDDKTEEKIQQKTDAEVILDGAEKSVELIKDLVENKHAKDDSIIKIRGKRLVYKIGNIKDNVEAVFETYNRLVTETTLDSSKIKVFEVKRNKLFIFYETAGTGTEINEKLDYYKNKIMPVEINVTIKDIYSFCSAKETIIDSKPLKLRKYDFTIPKCECDK